MASVFVLLSLALSLTIGYASVLNSKTIASSGSISYDTSSVLSSSPTVTPAPGTTPTPTPIAITTPTSTPNSTSTPTSTPTSTSTATSTPRPTSTPKTTSTPTSTPKPAPTSVPSGNNLALISDGQWSTDNPYGTHCPGVNIYTETATTHNGAATWRVEPTTSNWGADHSPIHVNVGDHIVMSAWIKTGGSSSIAANGARIGMDWWTSTQGPNGWDRIGCANNYYEAQTGSFAQSHDLDANSFVNWNHDWVQIRWDFYVQPQYASDGYYWPTGTMVSASTGFELLPWIGVVSQSGFPNGAYTCYFSDFQFQVNP